MEKKDSQTLRSVLSARFFAWVWSPVILITMAHYLTGPEYHYLHDIYRRLYYIPIVVAGFLASLRGALLCSIAVSIAYFPHAFATFAVQDPAHGLEKVLEMLLYNAVALIAGVLVERERKRTEEAYALSKSLEATIKEKEIMQNEIIRASKLSALGELLASLAHEIRNPLGALKGTAEIIADIAKDNKEVSKLISLHIKEINRLNDLVERLLQYAKPKRPELRPENIALILTDALRIVEAKTKDKRIAVKKEGLMNKDVLALVDRAQIEQVALNLLLNAVKVQGDGGEVQVEVYEEERGGRKFACFEVRDRGPGVPDELKEKVFEPFFTTDARGVGLGLSVAARIVEEHQGIIEILDREGGGTSVKVLLPSGLAGEKTS